MPCLITPPAKSPQSTDNEEERRTSIVLVGFYIGATRYLLIGIPFLAIVLLGASYVWDVEQGADCELSKAMLEFFGVAVRWYFGLVGVVVFGVIRIVALFQPKPKN